MRERINRLAKGIIDTENPVPVVTPSQVDETVQAGAIVKRELFIISENNLHIKGLAYSSDARVKVINGAFGGMRVHLNYEVNTNYLENGDIIKGSFYLVTNGGEKEIPYSFHVESGASGRLMRELKTAEDFVRLARKDMDTALRLFEYQDFPESPFMRDMHIRAVYEGLKGRGNRANLMEEFLVALGVKEAVELKVDEEEREYENPLEPVLGRVLIEKSCWGYVSIEVKADGEFIELSRKVIADQDFTDGRHEFVYQINPDQLHKGKNLGCITFSALKKSWTVKIRAMGDVTVDISEGDTSVYREGYLRYMRLRLDYETGRYEAALLWNQMLHELDQLQLIQGKQDLLTLLQAEVYLLSDRKDTACLLLDECRDSILSSRQEQAGVYCFYQYLCLLNQPNDSQRQSLVRLMNHHMAEKKGPFYMYLLLLKLDQESYENPGTLYAGMKNQFKAGCHSPFLYVRACRLLEEEAGLLRSLDSFELQVLSLGVKLGLVGKGTALAAARLANSLKHYNRLLYRLLKELYDRYPEKEILSAVCCLLIKGECTDTRYFPWYEKALEEGIGLTRLYEYYLYSLPRDYGRLLPREALLYFSYGAQLDRHSRSVLYMNILKYMDKDAELYKQYEREIEKFAMDQLFESRINSRLAVIYDRMIYRDVIDAPVAKVLPAILKSYRVRCEQERMKYVIVCYEELNGEDAFPLQEGVAYVPLFSEHSVLLFQDAYGNRYVNVDYEKEPVMEKPELEERCFEVYPEHPMLRLKECEEILREGAEEEKQVRVLEKALEELDLHPLYQKQLLSAVVGWYQKETEEGDEAGAPGEGGGYLLRLDKRGLSRDERVEVCETLICQSHIREAYELVREYGCFPARKSRLLKLCTRTILQKLFDEDELLLKLSYRVFQDDKNDSVILDYLCEHYNGTTEQMYRILRRAVADHVETYDMEERLAAQMLFSGATGKLDQVFELYVKRKKTSENIVKAYFTVKSAEYFLEEKPARDSVFAFLENALKGSVQKDKVPTIYLLALTRYYASLPALTEEQKGLCRNIVAILLEEGMIFAHYKELEKQIPMPEDIRDKGIVEYHGNRDSRVELKVRILPEEEEYHVEDMRRVYQGVFVMQKVLFEGEIMEYRVCELQGEEAVPVKEGSIECGPSDAGRGDSRYACLNELGLCLNLKEEERLKEKMREYLIRTAAARELFQLM